MLTSVLLKIYCFILLPTEMSYNKAVLQLRGPCLITEIGVDLLSLSVSRQHGLSFIRKGNVLQPFLMSPLCYLGLEDQNLHHRCVCINKYLILNCIRRPALIDK